MLLPVVWQQRVPVPLNACQLLVQSVFLTLDIPVGGGVLCSFNLQFPVTNDVEHPACIFFGEVSVKIFCLLKVHCFLIIEFLYCICPLSDIGFANNFSQFEVCTFIFLYLSKKRHLLLCLFLFPYKYSVFLLVPFKILSLSCFGVI